MWLKVLRQNILQLARRTKGSASIDQKNGSGKNRTNNNGIEANKNEGQNGVDAKNQKKKSGGGPGNGPLLHQAEISSSQLDFFRMLDEKIENGPDYDENVDATLRAQRISDLLRRWEMAESMQWSSVTDLNNVSNTGALNSADQRKGACSNTLSAKDREGMRNIIGGRPESAPIFMRNANRADGLEDVHCPSPNMPRHVLESISQSPTQTMKNTSASTASPTTGHRFHVYRVYDNVDNTNQMIHNNYHQNQMTNQNDDFAKQQALYREQYLQQTGIISTQAQYQNRNVLRNNAYVQQFPLSKNEEHFSGRKGNFNSIELT